jgi:hypothetical protein
MLHFFFLRISTSINQFCTNRCYDGLLLNESARALTNSSNILIIFRIRFALWTDGTD